MSDQITTRSVGRGIANIEEDFVLEETSMTRLIFRAQIHSGGIRGKIIRMRRQGKDSWVQDQHINIRDLEPGQGLDMELKTETVLKLNEAFDRLKSLLEEQGIQYGRNRFVSARADEVIVTDSNRAHFIKELLDKGYSEEIWQGLVEKDPDLATKFSYATLQKNREESLEEFEASINSNKDENYWQGFFEKNTWIFGYGLNYKILRTIQSQPNYGATNVSGTGGQRGDYLENSEANVKFTVLVEIKKPQSTILGSERYRNGAWELGEELTGGVSQLQTNCRTWDIEGSRTEVNREIMQEQNVNTVEPKGILVIGNTNQLTDHEKRNTFELFRRNINNPEILTFDELLERAKFIVRHVEDESEANEES